MPTDSGVDGCKARYAGGMSADATSSPLMNSMALPGESRPLERVKATCTHSFNGTVLGSVASEWHPCLLLPQSSFSRRSDVSHVLT